MVFVKEEHGLSAEGLQCIAEGTAVYRRRDCSVSPKGLQCLADGTTVSRRRDYSVCEKGKELCRGDTAPLNFFNLLN